MCVLCEGSPASLTILYRNRICQMLALLEHPDALPADTALRLGRELLSLTQPDGTPRRCELVFPARPAAVEPNQENFP